MNNLLYNYLFCKGIIWQQIESFDFFLKSDLKKILNSCQNQIFFAKSYLQISFSSIKIRNAVFLKKKFRIYNNSKRM